MKAKVEELNAKVKELTLDNATLKAEVEMYRKEAALPSFSKLALGQSDEAMVSPNSNAAAAGEEFISSGNQVYPNDPVVSLPNINGTSNPLCCALNNSDNLLASGGADGFVTLTAWGSALAPNPKAAVNAVSNAARVRCNAPVICISFSPIIDVICVGCMDGSVHFLGYSFFGGKVNAWPLRVVSGDNVKYTKYVKSISWSQSSPIVVSSSADGTVILSEITFTDEDELMEDGDGGIKEVKIDKMKSFHFSGAVESLCFVNEGKSFCLYERDTSYLAYFDITNEYKMTKCSLNGCKYVIDGNSFLDINSC